MFCKFCEIFLEDEFMLLCHVSGGIDFVAGYIRIFYPEWSLVKQ